VKTSLKTKLDTLVTAGTITQAQETAIQNLFTRDKTKDAQAGKEKFTNSLKTKLDTLVTAGTINQDQENAMITSLTSFPNKTSQN
jgi:competence protein ComGC